MAILYRTAKFKSANILAIAILSSTARFNSRQYFRLYGNAFVEYSGSCEKLNSANLMEKLLKTHNNNNDGNN